jgi:hypothetical protein
MTGGTTPVIMAAAGTLTGATSNLLPVRQHRKNLRKQREKNRILTTKRRPSRTAHPRRADPTTVAAGLPGRLSRNGQTTRTASKDVLKPRLPAATREQSSRKSFPIFLNFFKNFQPENFR